MVHNFDVSVRVGRALITHLLLSIPKLQPQNKLTIIYSFISINLSLFVIIIVFVSYKHSKIKVK